MPMLLGQSRPVGRPDCLSCQQLCSPAGSSAGNPSHGKDLEGKEMQVTAGTHSPGKGLHAKVHEL